MRVKRAPYNASEAPFCAVKDFVKPYVFLFCVFVVFLLCFCGMFLTLISVFLISKTI